MESSLPLVETETETESERRGRVRVFLYGASQRVSMWRYSQLFYHETIIIVITSSPPSDTRTTVIIFILFNCFWLFLIIKLIHLSFFAAFFSPKQQKLTAVGGVHPEEMDVKERHVRRKKHHHGQFSPSMFVVSAWKPSSRRHRGLAVSESCHQPRSLFYFSLSLGPSHLTVWCHWTVSWCHTRFSSVWSIRRRPIRAWFISLLLHSDLSDLCWVAALLLVRCVCVRNHCFSDWAEAHCVR